MSSRPRSAQPRISNAKLTSNIAHIGGKSNYLDCYWEEYCQKLHLERVNSF